MVRSKKKFLILSSNALAKVELSSLQGMKQELKFEKIALYTERSERKNPCKASRFACMS